MAEITLEESWRQIRTLTDRADQDMAHGRPDEAVDRWRAVLAHPCAHHQVAAYEILDEVHRAFREAGHYEEAIAAKREAIAAGYRSVPDPEADTAECLLDAGEAEEADALLVTLRQRGPEDVWLYISAAYSYAGIDVAASLRWALDGIEVALATGEPNQVVMQLLELAEAAWADVAEPIDEQFVDRAERFCEGGSLRPCGTRVARRRRWRINRARTSGTGQPPAGPNWASAPAGTDAACWRPSSAKHLPTSTPASARSRPSTASRHTPDGPDGGEARSAYAATLLAAGDAVIWPPGRNEPCWCGSKREYKKRCGPVPAAVDGAA